MRMQHARVPLLGAHVSAAGGLHHAIARAQALEAECLQIFTRAPGAWKARPRTTDETARFREAHTAAGKPPVLVHDIYLANLASPPGELRDRSIETVVDERTHCAEIGAAGLVCHMGAHLDAGVDVGLQRYADSMREVLARTEGNPVPILLENSAGQGTCLGHELGHIGRVLEMVNAPGDLGVCLDTCHLFAAGYNLCSEEGYDAMWSELERAIGVNRLRAWHLNDSKKGLRCRVDRHEHIGRGQMGLAPFRRLLADRRVAGLPMIIETPEVEEMHIVNLETLRAARRGEAE